MEKYRKEGKALWKNFVPILLFFSFYSISFAASKIEVKETWVSAPPPSSSLTAAYMVIENKGNEGDRLIKVSSEVSDHTEIHATLVNERGIATMKRVDTIDIPAGKVVEIKPGGYHIMLIGLKRPLNVGDKIEINLRFEKSGVLVLRPEVKEITQMNDHMMHHVNH